MDRKKRPSKTIEVLEKRAEGAESGGGAKGAPRHPGLYQINTRVWLTDLSGQLGRPATLEDIPGGQLDGLKSLGFDWIYLLGVWQTGRCYVRLPFPDLGEQPIRLEGRLGTPGYEREGSSLLAEGLYVDLPALGLPCF